MTGSEQAKAKEDAAAIMRAKQVAGTFFFTFSLFLVSIAVSFAAVLRLLCRSEVKLQHVGNADASRSRAKEGGRGQEMRISKATTAIAFDCGVQCRWGYATGGDETLFGVTRGLWHLCCGVSGFRVHVWYFQWMSAR
jgi:hypothetical protein